MKTIYEVFGRKADRERDVYFGAGRTREAAEEKIEKLKTGRWQKDGWRQYHDEFLIVEKETDCDYEPPCPKNIRELYTVRNIKSFEHDKPGSWKGVRYAVFKGKDQEVGTVSRNYPAMYRTFEPFRQGDKHFALVAPDYTATSVLDLQTGEIIASEEPHAHGFCPVGFYVPDWWDYHDESEVPGSQYWSEPEDRMPDGSFGFVWGCHWGDDSSWKVQHLDLSRIQEGIIARDDRYGYVELATIGDDPKQFIRYSHESNRVTFAREMTFSVETGKAGWWHEKEVEYEVDPRPRA